MHTVTVNASRKTYSFVGRHWWQVAPQMEQFRASLWDNTEGGKSLCGIHSVPKLFFCPQSGSDFKNCINQNK